MDVCEQAYALTYHPLYRAGQYFTFIFSLISIGTISHFIYRKLVFSQFHPNLKFLLISYFSTILLCSMVLIVMFIIVDLMMVYNVFKDEEFTQISISYLLTPNTSSTQLTTFFWFLLSLDFINFILNCILYKININLGKRIGKLSIRYEMEEIVLSTKFTICIIFLHFLFFGFYLSTIILIRTWGQYIFSDEISLKAARGIFITVPIYNMIIGIVSSYFFKVMNSQKNRKIKNVVGVRYSGELGAQNHDIAIFSTWNAIAKMKS
ncbi:unnamed protein product [Caenorhabditis angaria]|uniref:Uncharacterized protein n=1 Tax=Caenorhabditis angaria TaxID=860376 RepID=A0A9P1MWC9_9PELO|nr:unnamed protein product [Caenorhabditis angaria]